MQSIVITAMEENRTYVMQTNCAVDSFLYIIISFQKKTATRCQRDSILLYHCPYAGSCLTSCRFPEIRETTACKQYLINEVFQAVNQVILLPSTGRAWQVLSVWHASAVPWRIGLLPAAEATYSANGDWPWPEIRHHQITLICRVERSLMKLFWRWPKKSR